MYGLSRKCKREIGMIHEEATPETKANISVVLATLDYYGAVWDPHQSTLVNKLESVLCLLTQWSLRSGALHILPSSLNASGSLSQQVEELSSSMCVISYVISHWKSLPASIVYSSSASTSSAFFWSCLPVSIIIYSHLLFLTYLILGSHVLLAFSYLGFPKCILHSVH